MAIKKKMIFIGVIIALLSLASCKKNALDMQNTLSPNRVVPVQSDDSKSANIQWWTSEIGHDGRNCPGCVMHFGKMIHRDCMGRGHYCRLVARVILDTVGTDVIATTTDTFGLTSADFFLMPDRSLSYTDENNNRIFLNIPEQLLFRDSTTQQFTFTGLFFSDGPAYSNE